jgi:hypothetical protein
MAEALSIISSGLELAQGLSVLRSDNAHSKTRKREICLWLRTFYFMPSGVVSILEDIANGQAIDERRRESVMSSFNDSEWRIQSIADRLTFEELAKDGHVSLKTARQLDLVRMGKLSLRREIQDAINHYGQPRAPVNRDEVQQLVDAVRRLNAQIEEVDAALNG